MPTDLQALVRAPAWRWMPGMLTADGERIIRSNRNPNVFDTMSVDVDGKRGRLRSRWPDLTDPATLGCMLALAREAWADPTLHVICARGRWWAVSTQFEGGPGHETEGEALAAAIIAAPE